MLLDVFNTLYIWVGSGANATEKAMANQIASQYVAAAAETDGRDPDTNIVTVNAGSEPPMFTCHFLGWDAKAAEVFVDPYEKRKQALKSTASFAVKPKWAAAAASAAGGGEKKSSSFVDPYEKRLKTLQSQKSFKSSPSWAKMIPEEGEEEAGEVEQKKKASTFVDPYEQRLKARAAEKAKKRGSVAAAAPKDKLPQQQTKVPAAGPAAVAAPAPAVAPPAAAPPAAAPVEPAAEGKTFTYAQLKGNPCEVQAMVNAAKKEQYLSSVEFQEVFKMNKAAFVKMAGWKRKKAKVAVGLF